MLMHILTIAIPIVASENGSPAMFPKLKPLLCSPPYRPPLFISILRSDGEFVPKLGIESKCYRGLSRRIARKRVTVVNVMIASSVSWIRWASVDV